MYFNEKKSQPIANVKYFLRVRKAEQMKNKKLKN